ncbi:mevalonate kinase (MVK) [Vairimorpha necatrix]|uniref:Mevalonate kinase (MVK) n=1 Tax=Vairimorpha necatrix TaxID=6039 RepID=A0AAX4JAM8_9MICR
MINVATSPLKLILFGEHSVLMGGRCISLCINKYCNLYLPEDFVNLPDIKILIKDMTNSKFILSLDDNLKIESKDQKHNAMIKINCHLGCGLGSSAAISTLTSTSLYLKKFSTFLNLSLHSEKIFTQSNLIEDFFHGKSSGVDVATIKHGGMISFKEKEVEKMSTEYINNYKILIFNSKIPKDTKKIIKQVLNNKEKNYEKLKEISEEAYELLKKNFKLVDLYKLIRRAEDVLEDLGIVPEIMKKEVKKLRSLGIESKITGAGNGGHLFTVVEKNISVENWEEILIDEIGFKINSA